VPKREELPNLLYGQKRPGFSLSVEGTPVLLRTEIVTQDELSVGDKVKTFSLPDGKTFISKVDPGDKDAYTIGRITSAHIYFDDEMTVKEI
jgi:hypothetical protein